MRKEKLEELRSLMNELEAIKFEKLDKEPGFLSVESYKVTLRNGEVITRELLKKGSNEKHSGASVVFPITKEGNVILVVQPRVFTKSRIGIELPAGYIDMGENEFATAERELEEETGYKSPNLIKVASWYQDEGCSDAFNHSFLATDCLLLGTQKFDKDEFIKLFECTVGEAYEMLEEGYISGGGGIITMERSKKYIKRMM